MSKSELLARDPDLNQLIEPSFQGVDRLFVLAFEDDQPVKNNKVTNENIRKIATGKEDDYTTGCLLDYIYFKIIIK